MARGRFLSESIAKDTRLNSLSIEAELVYLMTIPHLDRDGLIEGDPDVLWGTVCPKRRQFIDRMAEFIQEWANTGLVACYDTDEGVVLWFKGFTKNQLGLRYDRETPSKFPPPPNLTPVDSAPQPSGNPPDASGNGVAQWQVQVQDQVKEREPARINSPSEPPAKTLRLKSPHLDPRHFVNGFIPPGTGANAVEVYYERFSINQDSARLNAIKEDDLSQLCTDLGKLREVVTAYSQTPFQLGNVRLILDWYRDGIPEKHKAQASNGTYKNGNLSEGEKSKLLTRAKNARSSLQTAQKFGGPINPQWQQDIEAAKGYGL